MQKEHMDILSVVRPSDNLQAAGLIVKPIEKIKLQHRAEKYQYKEDRGGIDYIRKNIKPGDIVFDIGAHKAGYLYFFLSQLGDTGQIFAFEPQSILYKYLRKLKQLFKWENVTVEPFAVSGETGTAVLCIPYNSGRSSSPCATIIESHTQFDFQSKEKVTTVSLDEYCRQYKICPDFLKVDVEGNELSVFLGAEEILRSCKPKILFECEARFVGQDTVMETFAFLLQLGYSGSFIKGGELRPIMEFDINSHQNPGHGVYCNNFIFE